MRVRRARLPGGVRRTGRPAGAAGLAGAADGAGVVSGADGAGGLSRLVAAAQAGDSAALTALARAGSALGVAVAGALNLLDLDQVVLGGTYATLFDWVAPEVERETRDRVLSWQWAPTVVRRSGLGADAAVVGAARSVLASVLSAPDAGRVRSERRLTKVLGPRAAVGRPSCLACPLDVR